MDGEAPRIADIGHVVEHLQRIDEAQPAALPVLAQKCIWVGIGRRMIVAETCSWVGQYIWEVYDRWK
jgi:hypothetical protein